jgi:1-acyl-sn-glycerol-3-phosphate acyltransferase
MLSKLRALLWIDPLIVLITIGMGLASVAMSLFDKTGRRQHRIARAWAAMLLKVSGVRLQVEGVEKLDPQASYVLVANHMSYMDIPAIMAAIPLEIRFFAKQGLFRIPFLGTHLRLAGHLPVVRGNARASLKTLQDAAARLRKECITPLLFPEGGRSPVALREFKEGAAHLAIKAGVPVVPVGLSGTREVLPMNSIVVRPGTVFVRVGDIIQTSAMKSHDRVQLTERLRDQIAELMQNAKPARERVC